MKYINFHPSDFGSPRSFRYLANRLDESGGEEEIDLSNPTKVSLSDIRHLRDQAETLENKEIAQLNHLMEYHLSLVEHEGTNGDFPSRIVWEIFHSPLAQRLDPALRMKVARILRIKKDELAQFAEKIGKGRKDVKDLNDEELIKMNRAFVHLRSYTDEETKKIRETLQVKMLQIGETFLQGYVIEQDPDTEETIVVRLPGTDKMTPHQQLWILELYRNFRQRHFWPGKQDPDKIKLLAKKAATEIEATIIDPEYTEDQNLKSMVLFWDLLEELDQLDADFEEVFSEESKVRIRRFIERGNQAQFLDWCDRYFNGNPKVLLEDHVRALIDIRDHELYTTPTGDLDQAKQDIEDRYAPEIKDPEEVGITPDEKTAREQKNTEIQKSIAKEKAEVDTTEYQTNAQLEQLFRESDDSAETDWIITTGERKEYEGLKKEIDELKQGKPDPARSEKYLVEGIFDLEKNKKDKGLTATQEATLKTSKAALEKAEKKFDKLKDKIERYEKFTSTWRKRSGLFLNQGQKAASLLDKYHDDLKARAESGSLHAADLSVIFMEDEDPEIEEVLNRKVVRDAEGHITSDTEDPVLEEEFKDFLIEARDRIGEVLEELAGEVVFEADPQSLSLEDRFASWNRQLSQALGTGAILEKLEAIDGEDPEGLYQNLIERSLHKKEVTIKELIDASINHHREAIFDTIRGSLPADEADQELFIGQHGRFHQNLKDSDTYSKLKSKRTELSERQTQVYRDAQEAQHKVYELFPNTEWNRIWTIAEALIDEDGWQEIADQMLLDDEDLDREIKKEEAIKEAFLAFGRKHRWHINPVNMDVFWKPLVKAGIPHNFYTNLLDASSLVLNDTLARDEVSEAIEYNHERLSGGENTDFPGEKLLNEVEIQVMPYRMDIQRQCEEYTKHFMQLQDSFDHNPQALQSTLNLIHELRVELVPYLRTQKEEIQAMLEQLAPDKAVFIKAYLESIEAQISGLETSAQKHWEGLQDTERNEARGYKFSKDDELFTHFPGMFGGIDKSFSFIDGDRGDFMDKHFEEFKDSQKKVPESVAFIKDKLGLFEVGGRDKAREKYEQIQQKYGHTFHKFDENYEVYTKRMNTDMKLLTDAEFTQRHGESKAQVGQNIMMLNEHHKGFQQIWGKYEDPDFFQNWIKQYENPESRSSAISEFDFWDTISQQENTMENLNHGFGAWITAHNKSWVEETGPVSLEQLWHKTKKGAGKFLLDDVQWYSINGIMGMFQDVMEITKRLSERRTEKEKALLGKVIFGESGVWGLGHEFTRKSTESEEARVDEYKNRYKRKDPWSIKKELYAVRGPGEADKARALIDLLVEKGQIRWNDPELWYVLNRLNAFNSGAPQFSPADIEKDQGEIRDKVRYACEAIWDDYVFAAWDGSLPGNYKNAKEASFNKFDNMESYGDREAIWADMLDKWKRGVPDETVDPAEYEGFLFRAFQNGKVNGQPDRRWFYLIMGTTVKNPRGETLVSREIFDRLDGELLSTVPYFDFFTDKSSPKKDGRIVPEGTPGAHPTWTFEDMEAWGDFFGGSEGKFGFHAGKDNKVLQAKCHEFFYNFICSSDNAMMRVDRMNRGASKNADHDDAQMWFAGMSFQGMAQMLNRASEGTDLVTPDFAGTLLQGFDLFMKASYEYIMRGDAEYGIDNVGWQKMREKRLMQTGQRMRVAFGALHTVSGNYKGNAQQTPLTLDQSFWNQNKYDVKGSRDKISEAIQDLLKENGKDLAEYDGIWDFVGTKEISENGVDRSNNKEWQKVNKKISNIVGSADEDLGVSHFEELGSVEKVLKKYAMNHGGIYDTGAKNENPKFLYKEEKNWESSSSTNSLGL